MNKVKEYFQKLVSIILVVALVSSNASIIVQGEAIYANWNEAGLAAVAGVDYTAASDDSYYATKIHTALGLAYIASNPAGYLDRTILLTADIDLNDDRVADKNWNPINTTRNGFCGTFDGQGHTISNLTINREGTDVQGLFGYIGSNNYKGTVKNVKINNPNVSGKYYVGALAGNAPYATITNCSIIGGEVKASKYNGGQVGGVIGYGVVCYISNCSNSATITGGYNGVGGIAGNLCDDRDTVDNCYNSGTVTGTMYVGGLVGESMAAITNCYNTGNISGNTYVGGLIGNQHKEKTITNCFAAGSVSGTVESTGALLGGLSSDTKTAEFINCYYDSDTYTGETIAPSLVTLTNCHGKTTRELASQEVATSLGTKYGFKSETTDAGYYPYLTYFNSISASQAYLTRKKPTITVSIDNWDYGVTAATPVTSTTSDATNYTYTYYSDAACQNVIEDISSCLPGTYYITTSVEQTDNFLAATSAATEFHINKLNNPITNLAINNWVCHETASTPTYDATNKQGATISYSTSENENFTTTVPTLGGTYFVKVSIPSTSIYNESSATTSFTINKVNVKDIVFPTLDEVSYDKDKTLEDYGPYDYTVGGKKVGTFSWENKSIVPTVSNSGYKMIFTPTDEYSTSYDSVIKTISLTVNSAAISVEVLGLNTTYNGKDQKPSVPIVKDKNSNTALDSSLYTIKYSVEDDDSYELTDIPTYHDVCDKKLYFQITASNYETYKGSIDVTINKVKIENNDNFEFTDENGEDYFGETLIKRLFTGSSIEPKVNISYKGEALELGTDYKVSYANNKVSSNQYTKAIINVTGSGNYNGEVELNFEINKISLNSDDLEITGIEKEYEYTGAGIHPKPVVTYKGKKLTEGVDYNLFYTDNDEIGKGKVKVLGTGLFGDSIEILFDIVQGINTIKHLSIDSWVYGEAPNTPKTISDFGADTTIYTYSSEEDGIYSDKIPIDVGKYWIKATIPETTRYAATSKVGQPFTIGPLNVNHHKDDCDIDVDSVIFNGKNRTPNVTVSIGNETISKTLKLGTDYTVQYTDNVDAGQGTATITFKGNYYGTLKEEFTINKAEIIDITNAEQEVTYGGKTSPTIKAITVDDCKYTVTYLGEGNLYQTTVPTLKYAGTMDVVYRITAPNHETVTGTVKFVVNPKDVNELDMEYTYFNTYTGSEIKSLESISYDKLSPNPILSEDIDYIINYNNNINCPVNESTISNFTIEGIGNYTGTLTQEFVITQATTKINILMDKEWEYGQWPKPLEDVAESNFGEIEYEYTSVDGEEYGSTMPTNTGVYNLRAYVKNTNNYYSNEVNFRFEITKSRNRYGYVFPDFMIYGDFNEEMLQVEHFFGSEYGKAQMSFGTLRDYDDLTDPSAYENVEFTNKFSTEVGFYVVKFNVEGTSNYNGITVYHTFIIAPKGITDDDIILKDIQDAEYTGNEIKQDIDITDKGVRLVKDVDYLLTYKHNKNVGTSTLEVEGIGNYTETTNRQFNITQADNSLKDLSINNWYYGTNPSTPSATSDFGDIEYSYSTSKDYGFSTKIPTEVGTYYVQAFVQNTANYSDATTVKEFKILQTANMIHDLTIENWAFGDTPNIPTATSDYGTITYEYSSYKDKGFSNVIPTNAGTYYVQASVEENPNYQAVSQVAEFKILKTQNNISDLTINDWEYGSTPSIPSATSDNGVITYSYSASKDNGFSSKIPTEAGTYYVRATIQESDNYLIANKVKQFKIISKDINDTLINELKDEVYTGNKIEKEIKVKDHLNTLVENVDYTLEYISNINVSTSTVKVTGIGNYTGIINKTFKILQADNEIKNLTIDNWSYGNTPSIPSATSNYGIVEYKYSDSKDGEFSSKVPTDAGIYYVQASVREDTNFEGASDIKEFTIKEKSLSSAGITLEPLQDTVYTGEEITPKVVIRSGKVALVEGEDYVLDYKNNTLIGTASITIKGIGNYSGNIETTFEIGKKPHTIAIEDIPMKTYGDSKFEINVSGLQESCDVQYSVEPNNGVIQLSDNLVTIIGVGTVEITATTKGNEICDSSNATYTLVINKKDVSVVIDDQTIVRGMDLPTLTGTSSNEQIIPTYQVIADTNVSGKYDITMSNLDQYTNYNITVVSGVLTVTKGYTVSFNGEKQTDIAFGTTISKPIDPVKKGYTFTGWMIGNVPFDFETKIVQDYTLTSSWQEELQTPDTGDHNDTILVFIPLLLSLITTIVVSKKRVTKSID